MLIKSSSLWDFIKRNVPHFFSIGIPLLFIPFLYSDQVIDPVLIPKFLAFAGFLLIYGIFLLSRIFKVKNGQWSVVNNNFVKLFLAYFIISALSLIYSVNFSEGLFEVAKIGLFLMYLIFILFQYGETDNLIKWLPKYLILFSTIIGIAGLYQFFNMAFAEDVSHWKSYDISVTFAHKNLYSQVLLLSAPFALYGALTFNSIWRVLGIISSFLSLFLVTILLSRASWIALFSAGCLTTILWVIMEGPKEGYLTLVKKNIKRAAYISGILLVVISLSIFTYSKLDTFDTFTKQITSIGNFQHSSTKDRISLWKKSFQLAGEHPLIGSGAGSWKIQIHKTGTGNLKSLDGLTFFQRPHNDFLQILCETGIGGLIVYFLLFLIAMKYILVILQKEKEGNTKLFAYLVFFGLVEYLVFSFFSFPKERYEQVLLFCLPLLPIIIHYYNTQGRLKRKITRGGMIGYAFLGFLILAFSMLIGYRRFESESYTKLAFMARANSDWEQVIKKINIAESPFYQLDPTSTPLRWYSGSAHFNSNNLKNALKDFQKARDIHPYHIHVLNNLASTYVLLGQTERAMKIYDEAITINPVFGEAHLNKAIVYYNDQEMDKAYHSIRNIHKVSDDYRHSALLLRILKPQIIDFLDTVEQHHLKLAIARIQNDEAWLLNVHFKSVNANRSFEYQLILDALYLLEIEDKTISRDEAKDLQSIYGSKYGWI